MIRPLVSVLLPVRNSASTLMECLDSIRDQSLPGFEVIAVNDGSTDDSQELLERYAAKDSRFRVFSPGAIGFVAALNFGIQEARAHFIARMDADDTMAEQRLQLQSAFLEENPDIPLVGSRVELFPADSIAAGYREYIRWQNSCVSEEEIDAGIYVESPFAHPSVMFRKTTIMRAGGYRDGAFPEDYELWLRMRESGMRMAKLPKVLLRWREGTDRLSRTDPRYSRDAFDFLRAEYLARDKRIQSAKEIVFWGAGRSTRKRIRLLLDRGIQFSGWIDIDPKKIGKVISGRVVHPKEWLDRTPHPLVLVYVTNHGARDLISSSLKEMGFISGIDFLCVG